MSSEDWWDKSLSYEDAHMGFTGDWKSRGNQTMQVYVENGR